MNSNHEPQGYQRITVNEKLIKVPRNQFKRACEYSAVIRHSENQRFDIPPRDSAAGNFDFNTVVIFFSVFNGVVGTYDNRDLDFETLVRLCHAFWWLRCDTAALRESQAVKHLRTKIQQHEWTTLESTTANRLIISLSLGWEDILATSCQQLVYKTMNRDENLFFELPNAVTEREELQQKTRDKIIAILYDTASSPGKLFDKLSNQTVMPYLQRNGSSLDVSPEDMVTRLQESIRPRGLESPSPSVANTHRQRGVRFRSAGGKMVQQTLEWMAKLKEGSNTDLLYTALESLKSTMAVDVAYRDACIRVWMANRGDWGGEGL